MQTHGLARWGIAAAMVFAAGCQTPPASSTAIKATTVTSPPPVSPAAEATAKTPSVEGNSPLPDALARKTAEYARSLESTAGNESQAQSSATPRRPKFLDPPVNPTQGANAATVLPPPHVEPSAVANAHPDKNTPIDSAHVTTVAQSAKSNALDDVPAIVPESSDFTGPSPVKPAVTDDLGQRLAKLAQQRPRDIASQLDYQLYELLSDEQAPQLASISSLPDEDREVVAALVDGINNFRMAVRQDNNMLLSKKIRPILDMADRIRAQGELSLPVVALCKRVDGFGKYDPIDPARFPAGQDNPAIVYCEVQNFSSHLNARRQWETKLTQSVTLFTDTGLLVWKDKPRPVTDECRDRRHDFFVYDLVKLPASLSIGRYLLKVTIVDTTAKRVAESTLPVEIVAQ